MFTISYWCLSMVSRITVTGLGPSTIFCATVGLVEGSKVLAGLGNIIYLLTFWCEFQVKPWLFKCVHTIWIFFK